MLNRNMMKLIAVICLGFTFTFNVFAQDGAAAIEDILDSLATTLHNLQTETLTSTRRQGTAHQTEIALIQHVDTLRQHIPLAEGQLEATFATLFEQWDYDGLSNTLKQRHLDIIKHYQDNAAKLLSDLDLVLATTDTEQRQSLIFSTLNSLKSLQSPKRFSFFDPEQLAFSVTRPIDRTPFTTQHALQQFYGLPTESLPAQDSTSHLRSGSRLRQKVPSTADLAETEEVRFTADIQQLAQSLEYHPINIFNWVHDNIAALPAEKIKLEKTLIWCDSKKKLS